MSRVTRWFAANGTGAFALAVLMGIGGFAALAPTQAEARDYNGGRGGRGSDVRQNDRGDNRGGYDRGRGYDRGDRGWQRRSNQYAPRSYYAPRYYRYTPPRAWSWYQQWPAYYDYRY